MRVILLILVLISGMSLPGSEYPSRYPKNYFRSPVDFPILLAGGFADIRQNHFHSGIDIRTGGEEGKPVYAIADGFISRINISSTGFGKAVYITHPNGFTSVYGHLKKLNGAIGQWTREQQYKKESFEMDVPVEAGVLRVRKGDLIALSGNTGLSEGPHLHFEIRDAVTQEIINPFLFGLPFKDSTPPKISDVRIYPVGENSMVNFSPDPLTLQVSGSGKECRITAKDTIKVSGRMVFGIQAVDFSNDTGSRDGIYSIQLYVDTTCYFSQKFERFAFAETRYANSELDYPQVVRNGQRIMRSYIAPNNKLSMYGIKDKNGTVTFSDSKRHEIRYSVSDIFGNTSVLTFWVKSHLPVPAGVPREKMPAGTILACGKPNHFSKDGLTLDFAADALYEDLDFTSFESPAAPGCYSPVYHLENDNVPLHSACVLSINSNCVPRALIGKAVVVKVAPGGHLSGKSTRAGNGCVVASIKEFGNYSVSVDTVPPVIKPLNIKGGRAGKQQSLAFHISDNLSGVQYYRGTLNGKWILMDFDAKSGNLIYLFDEHFREGKNEFRLVVRDAAGNESDYHASLTR